MFLVGGLGLVILLFVATGLGLFGSLPTFEEIENPDYNLASQLISADGEVIGKFYTENRTYTEYKDLSPHLVNALIATEDERYYDHSGIDFRGLARGVVTLGAAGGGSTITQQLAKMLFHEPASNLVERVIQKMQEWIIATRLERRYAKEEIIAMYFNQFDFLYQAVGINSAASIYFQTTPADLRIEQAALLVGMAKNPSYFNPVRDSTRALQRRNVVLGQMLRNDVINEAQYDSLKVLPLGLDFSRQGYSDGMAPYFREYVRQFMKEWIENHTKPDGSKYNLYTDGLKVYVSIDSRLQAAAEEAVHAHLANLQSKFIQMEGKRKQFPFRNLQDEQIETLIDQAMRRTPRYKQLKREGKSDSEIRTVFNTPVPMDIFTWQGERDTVLSPRDSIRYYKTFYNCGLISVEPQTGFIKAWVGGINFKHFKYDHVYQGRRQVGSTFKPFVYATAIKQKHYSPCFEVPNVITCIEAGTYGLLEDWCPENSEPKYGDMITLKSALANSRNTVTTYLMKQVGPEPVVRLAKELGVESEIPAVPSIALGSVDLSPYEMAGAYTAFGNKGVYTKPIGILRIEDKNGLVLEDFAPEMREVMSEEDAFVVVDLLKGVTQGGTGGRLRYNGTKDSYNGIMTGYPYKLENPIAGKTGTTQNNSDGWFIGMVPNLITAVWTGCEDRAAHFGSTTFGQGAATALPVFGLYMTKVYANPEIPVSKSDFEWPSQPLNTILNCAEYKRQQSNDLFSDQEEEDEPQF
jgi:penicillin-binding protein 1A